MRITIHQVLLTLLLTGMAHAREAIGQELLGRRVTLSVQQEEVSSVLKAIEKAADVRFMYSYELIGAARRISLEASNEQLNVVLDRLLKPLNLTYQVTRRHIVLKRLESSALPASPGDPSPAAAPAELNVSGQVTGDKNDPIPGVSVVVKGTTRGTATNAEGRYQLAVPDGNAVLVFSYVGYLTEEVAVGNRTTVNVTLLPDVKSLSEVVVIGYGTVKKTDLTGSVAQVRAETLKELPIASVEQGLLGRAPGVQVIQSSGQPGAGLSVRVRGNSSIAGGNEPLYVIDGFPLFNGDTRNLNGLSSINPDDIESIEILKDASATAIYGSRGANGVVIITTKTAREGQNDINFEAYYGMQQVRRKLDLLDGPQYAEIVNTALVNDGKQPYFDLNNLPANTDWQDEIFRTAPIQNYTLSYAGGTEKARYVIAGNLFEQQGIIINSGFLRGSVRLNLNNEISKRLKLQTRLLLSRSVQEGSIVPDGTNALAFGKTVTGGAIEAAPTIPVYDQEGKYAGVLPYPFSGTEGENPVAIANDVTNRRGNFRILGGINAGYTILEGLVNNFRVGIDYQNNRNDYYVTGNFKNLGSGRGDARQFYGQGSTFLLENTLTYNTTIGNSALEVLGGFAYQIGRLNTISASASGFLSDDLGNAALQAGSIFGVPVTAARDSTLLSWFGRVRYTLKDRYLFTVSGRTDGASQFSENNKYGFFPSASFAWRISEENFLQSAGFLSNLKLRTSWGRSGNPAIPAYLSLSVSSPIQTTIGDQLNLGLAPTRLANPDLKWETTTQYNVGLDIGILNERFRATLDYYVKRTDDLLSSIILPASSGFTTIIGNIGASENKGFELGIGADVLTGKAFRWSLEGNLATNQNRVTKTKDGTDLFGRSITNGFGSVHIVRPGQPIGAYYGTVFSGLGEDGLTQYVDRNGDGRINGLDRVVLGKAFPDLIYGLNSKMNYRNFELTVFWQGVQGVEIINITTPRNPSPITNLSTEVLNYYPRPGAIYQAPSFLGVTRPTVAPGFNSLFVEDGSYLRLKNVRLGYTFPKGLLGNRIKSLNVYASAQNLITLTRYTGYDPEVNAFGGNDLRLGVDNAAYPTNRTYLLGLRLGL